MTTSQRWTQCGRIVIAWACAACTAWSAAQAGAESQPATMPATQAEIPILANLPHIMVAGLETAEGVDPRDNWLGTAIEETLAWRLRRAPGVLVVPTVRAYQARRELQEDDGPLPEWPRVGSALGAEVWLSGRCSGAPDAVALHLSLREIGPSGRVLAEASLPPGALFTVLDHATSWSLEKTGAGQLSAEGKRLVFSPPARSPSALEYYARAVTSARADNFREAGYYALQVLDYDNGYRPALAMLGQLEMQRGGSGLVTAGVRLRALSELARLQDDALDQAAAELGHGVLLRLHGSFDAAYVRLETSLALSYRDEWVYGQLTAINALCDLYLTRALPAGMSRTDPRAQTFEAHNLQQSARWQEMGVGLLAAIGDVVAETPAANKLALTYERLGAQDQALGMHQRTLKAAERTASRRNQATAWLCLAQWYQRQKRWDEAVAATQHCMEMAPESKRPDVQLVLAGILEERESPAPALEQYEQAYEKLRSGDDLQLRLVCLRHIASLRMKLERREAALTALTEAIDIAHALESPDEAALQEQLKDWKSREAAP